MLLEVGGVRKGRVPIGKVFIRHNAGSESQKATLNAARSGWGQEGKEGEVRREKLMVLLLNTHYAYEVEYVGSRHPSLSQWPWTFGCQWTGRVQSSSSIVDGLQVYSL